MVNWVGNWSEPWLAWDLLWPLIIQTLISNNRRHYLRIIQNNDPDLIVNAVAYTDVDKAESEPEIARTVNATSVGVVAEVANKRKIPFIHYSTDFIFNGTKGTPYTEEDTPDPINVYGQTKLEGELAIQQVGGAYLILRTSWVYSLRKGGFVNKVLEWSRNPKIHQDCRRPGWEPDLGKTISPGYCSDCF